jgi:hypothetical protein
MCRQIFWDLDATYYEDRQDADETEAPPSRKNTKNIKVEKQDTYGIPLLDPEQE